MEGRRIGALLIGDCTHAEFARPVQHLSEKTNLDQAATIDAALETYYQRGEAWQIVVFVAVRPGQFAAADIERIHRQMPLARLIGLFGSWCEGESRSGQPWPGVTRVYWHQWLHRWDGSAADTPAGWDLPRTASTIELMQDVLQLPQPVMSGTVAIATTRTSFFDALTGACQQVGLETIRFELPCDTPSPPVDVALWEPCSMRGYGWEQLAQLVRHLAPVPVVALLNFPRYQDLDRVRELGAADVVTCPFVLPDLWAAMRAAMAQSDR